MSDRRLSYGFWLVLFALVLPAACYAAPDTVWTFRYAGTAGGDYQPLASFVDARSATGHVYVAGWAQQPMGGIDALLLKISADSGHLVWDKTYPDMTASGAAMDTSGNVYIAGVTTGTTAAGKICILKYLPSGDTTWTRTYSEQGLSFTSVGTIAIDDSQNVYACGRSDSTVRIVKYLPNGMPANVMSYTLGGGMSFWHGNFHILGSEEAYLAMSVEHPTRWADWLVVKLSPDSRVVWERAYKDTGSTLERLQWSDVDERANIYLTGDIVTSPIGADAFCTMKMDSAGTVQWITEYDGPQNLRDMPRFLLFDRGSTYVGGWSMYQEMGEDQAIALVKYDSLGDERWVRRYGSDDTTCDLGYEEIEGVPNFRSVNVDDSGVVYVTGYAYNRGTGVVGILLQYDQSGNLVSLRKLSVPGERWFGATVDFDNAGALYNTGIAVRDNGYIDVFLTKYRGRQK